ncbi:MAG: PAC2 family protein [Dehalococcoidia bacterium]
MDYLRIGEVPQLRDPILVIAFAGWSDAGQAATGAARFLVSTWSAQRLGDLDPEEFYNFAEQRPQIRLLDGMLREITWPANEYFVHVNPDGRDFVLLIGVEPHLRWRTFADTVQHMIERCGIKLVLTLGGLLVDVPHSRPVRVTGASTDELLARLRQSVSTGSRYEGPTGITGVLGDRFRQLGLSTATPGRTCRTTSTPPPTPRPRWRCWSASPRSSTSTCRWATCARRRSGSTARCRRCLGRRRRLRLRAPARRAGRRRVHPRRRARLAQQRHHRARARRVPPPPHAG